MRREAYRRRFAKSIQPRACVHHLSCETSMLYKSDQRRFAPGRLLDRLADAVDRLRLRLVVRAHEHLAEQPERHELHADDYEQDREQHDRPPAETDTEHDAFEAELRG